MISKKKKKFHSSLRRSPEPILGRVFDLKRGGFAFTARRRAPASRVDSINLFDVPRDVVSGSIDRRIDHGEFQPGHRWCTVWPCGGPCRSGGVGYFLGIVDSVVGSLGVKVEHRSLGVRKVVVSRQGQVARE